MSLESPARLASVVYRDPPGRDDPAELYHEASKLVPATAGRMLAGVAALAASPPLLRVVADASLRRPEAPLVPLPTPLPLTRPLGSVLTDRRSQRDFEPGPVTAAALAALLEAAYGETGSLGEGQPLRACPSAGALYPLDVFVAVRAADSLDRGLYRFEPSEHGLESLGDAAGVAAATANPELAESAAVLVVLAATFWRSRFKYGLRAYRFTLLEAGHAAQNLLLAATALGLAAAPLGGFFDGRMDEALALDGVDRGSLYAIAVGAGGSG